MKITRIETFTVSGGWKNFLFVHVHTDTGLVGLGEGTLNGFIKTTEAAVRELREETGLPVSVAEDPLCSVVLGTGKMLSDFDLLRKISLE